MSILPVRWLAGFVLVALLTACGGEEEVSGITITDAWARETTAEQSAGVAYFTLENAGPVDRLVAINVGIADRALIHRSETVDGVSRMRPMRAVAIPTGVPVIFQPGGLHVMLVGLKDQLRLGQRFQLVLEFEHAEDITFDIRVQAGENWRRGGTPELEQESSAADQPTPDGEAADTSDTGND
jgi:copper(I)-binding protein